MSDDRILKGVVINLARLGVETIERASEEGQKVVESIITGKELLGLDRTMTDEELERNKQQERIKSQQEIDKIKGEMGGGKIKDKLRSVEEEMTQLRRQKRKTRRGKEEYYEQQEEKRRNQRETEQERYNDLGLESTNPSKQKKSKGSAFANKKKHKPDTSQTSATQEYKGGGKID